MFARIVSLASLFVATQLVAAEPPITAAVFVPDGHSIIVGSQSGLKVYAWPQLTQQQPLTTSLAHVHDLAFSPNGKTLAAVGGRPAEEGKLELFDWPNATPVHQRRIGDDLLYRVAWQRDGETLAVAGPNRAITFLDRAGNPVDQLEGHSQDVMAVAYLPDGQFLSASRDNTIRVWRQPGHELIRTLNNHTNEIHDIAVRPGSTEPPFVLASSSADRTVRFWWPVPGRLMRFIKLPSAALDIDWTPDGATVIAACADGHVRTIDADSVEIIHDVDLGANWLHTIAAASDGASAFVGGSNGLMRAVKIR